MNTQPSLLTVVLTAFVTAFFAQWLTAWFALRRFRAEKWWEQKFSSYKEIFEALHHMGNLIDEELKVEMSHRILSDEENTSQRQRYDAAKEGLVKQLEYGEFLLSRDTVGVLRELMRKLSHAGEPRPPQGGEEAFPPSYSDYLFDANTAVIECLQKVRISAESDLRGRRWRRRRTATAAPR